MQPTQEKHCLHYLKSRRDASGVTALLMSVFFKERVEFERGLFIIYINHPKIQLPRLILNV